MSKIISKLIQQFKVYIYQRIVARVLAVCGMQRLPYFEICLTTRCTLKCESCANLNTHYYYMHKGNKLCDVPLSVVLQSARKLLNNVGHIKVMRILGGEPFLYKDIMPVLKLLGESNKISELMIITNATVVPKDEVLELMAKYNISCYISDYGSISSKLESLQQALKKHNVSFTVNRFDWHNFGDTHPRNRTHNELKDAYRICSSRLCRHILQGKIYLCPRAAHGDNLELYSIPKSEIVDLLESSNISIRRQIYNLHYNAKYTVACNYCDPLSSCSFDTKIPTAKQLSSQELTMLRKANKW